MRTFPKSYVDQMQAEMLVTGATVNLLAVEFYDELDTGGFVPHFLFEDPHIIAIERDDERIAELVAIAEQFLDMGTPDTLDIFLADYARADAREKAAKAEKDEFRKLIAKEIAERPSGKYVGDLGSVTQGKDKTETVTVFDEARFKEKAPKTWAKYVDRKGKDHEGATHHHPREGRKRSCMSNHIEIHNPSTAVEMNVSERQQYASVLADANMIPKAFQKSPANIFVAIEYGNALGIAPIVALNEINVINGTPSCRRP